MRYLLLLAAALAAGCVPAPMPIVLVGYVGGAGSCPQALPRGVNPCLEAAAHR